MSDHRADRRLPVFRRPYFSLREFRDVLHAGRSRSAVRQLVVIRCLLIAKPVPESHFAAHRTGARPASLNRPPGDLALDLSRGRPPEQERDLVRAWLTLQPGSRSGRAAGGDRSNVDDEWSRLAERRGSLSGGGFASQTADAGPSSSRAERFGVGRMPMLMARVMFPAL